MPTPIDDTLTPRNDADFPIVDGPVRFKLYNPLPSLPDAQRFPSGTTVRNGADNEKLYKVDSTGNDWELAGGGGSGVPSGTDGQFLSYVGTTPTAVTLTQDMIAPAFAVSLAIVGVSNPLEAGDSVVNPQFTMTHNQTPDNFPTIVGPDATPHNVNPASLTTAGYGGAANTFPPQTFTDDGSVLNKVFTWTYSATVGSISRNSSVSRTFERRAYYDMVDIGTYNSAFITALASTRLQAGFASSYVFGAGDGVKFAHMALPVGWGDPSTFKEHVSGLPVSWTKVASSVSVTNVHGVVILYNVWRAPQANTSAFTYDVS
jgi:hypothetical protein